MLNLPSLNKSLKRIIKNKSPIRFLNTVVMAQLADNLLL